MKRIRTITEALQMLKKEDPNTGLSEFLNNYKIRSFKTGNKILIDYDSLITPVIVQGFLDDMMMKRYEKKSARLTGDLNQYLKSHCIKQVDALKKIGISKSILASANAGYCIRIENAEKICNALGLKYDDYFTT